MRLNQWLDSCPRPRVRAGDTVLPTYFVAGLSGVGVAALAVMVLSIWTGASLLVSIFVSMLACATFVGFGVVRSRVTKQQKIVLLEHFLVVELVAWATLELLSLPVLRHLDLLTAGLSIFLVFGRIGCFFTGCCYGIESPLGVVYPRECGHASRRRRFPIQLLEAAFWAAFAALATGAILFKSPGTALALVLGGYGALRLMLEPVRGDARPKYLGLTQASWLSLSSLAAAVWLHDRSAPLGAGVFAGVAAFSVLVPIILRRTHRAWLVLDFDRALHAEVAAIGVELSSLEIGPSPVVRSARDLVFAASRSEDSGKRSLSVSVSSPARKIGEAEASLLLEWMMDGLGAERGGVHPVQIEGGVFLASVNGAPGGRC